MCLQSEFLAEFHREGYEYLLQENNWSTEAIQHFINNVSAEFDINMSKIGQPLRVAVTGQEDDIFSEFKISFKKAEKSASS